MDIFEEKLKFEQDIIDLLKKHKFLREDVLNFITEAELTIVVTVSAEKPPRITFNGEELPELILKLSLPGEI